MNSKNLLIGTLVGGVAFFLLGYLLYGLLLEGYFMSNMGSAKGVMKANPNFPVLILGNLIGAFLLTYIFDHWAGIKTFLTGAKAGALIALLMALSFNLINFATANVMTMNTAIVDGLVQMVMGAIAGGTIGWVLGNTKLTTT